MKSLSLALVFTLVTTATMDKPAAAAPAQPAATTKESSERPRQGLTLFGLAVWQGVGVGGRYMVPLAIPSVLPKASKVRDQWALEFGADLTYESYSYGSARYRRSYGWTEFRPSVGMMWQVWLSPKFAVYPKAEGGYGFGRVTGWDDNWGYKGNYGYGGTYIDASGGLLYRTDGGLILRAEGGFHNIRAGIAFLF